MIRHLTASVLATILAGALVAACGTTPDPGGNGDGDGDGNGNGNGGQVDQLGFVSLYESRMDEVANGTLDAATTDVDGGGAFFQTSEPLPAAFLADPFQEELEQCDVFDAGAVPEPDPIPEPPGTLTFTMLDAGTTLTVEAAGSTVATFARESMTFEGETFIVYELEGGVSGPLPGDLTLTVPGADYPAFADEPFPSAAPFALTDPADGTGVGVDTAFAWDPSGASNAHVTLSVRSDDFMTYVTCITADDGTFEFPAETKGELGAGFSGSVSDATRTVGRVVVEQDAALVLTASSSQAFPIFVFGTER